MALFDRFKKKTEEAVEGVKETTDRIVESSGQATETADEAASSSAAEGAPSAEETADTIQDAPNVMESVESPPAGTYRTVHIKPGKRGWGTGLTVTPEPGKDLIYSVTGGGIHPVAQRIADLSGGKPFDGFKSKADFHEIAVAVIDCGGTARIGVYPMKGVPTVDVHGASPSGPLMRFITEENFVSGCSLDDIELVEE